MAQTLANQHHTLAHMDTSPAAAANHSSQARTLPSSTGVQKWSYLVYKHVQAHANISSAAAIATDWYDQATKLRFDLWCNA